MVEKRKHPRFMYPVSAAVQYRDNSVNNIEMTSLMNISRGGACFTFTKHLLSGSEIYLNFVDMHTRQLKNIKFVKNTRKNYLNIMVKGEVVRSQALENSQLLEIAVRFTEEPRVF